MEQATIPRVVTALVKFYENIHETGVTAESTRLEDVWAVKGVSHLGTSTMEEASDMGMKLIGAKHESNGMTLYFRVN